MRVTIRLFAQMRITAGAPEIALELPEGATVAQALEAFFSENPSLCPYARSCMVALGVEYTPPERVLREGDEIALIPPVQGG